MPDPGFVHLRVHSRLSLEGALPIKTLAELAVALDQDRALGLADTGNLFGALEFAEKMVEKRHPADHRLPGGGGFRRPRRSRAGGSQPRAKQLFDIVLIAAGEAGYWNLVRLVSSSFIGSDPGVRRRTFP